MKIYRLLLCIYLVHSIFALEAEITQKLKVKRSIQEIKKTGSTYYSEAVFGCIKDNNWEVVYHQTLEGCKQKCSPYTWCNSLDFDVHGKTCYLSGETKHTKPSEYSTPCANNKAFGLYVEKIGSLPTICSRHHIQYYPDPKDCDKFYQCSEGQAPIQKPCPSGTRLNFKRQTFVNEANVDCWSKNYSAAVFGCIKDFWAVVYHQDLEACKQKCSLYTWCNSLDFDWAGKTCYLSGETKDTKPSEYSSPCANNKFYGLYLEKIG